MLITLQLKVLEPLEPLLLLLLFLEVVVFLEIKVVDGMVVLVGISITFVVWEFMSTVKK